MNDSHSQPPPDREGDATSPVYAERLSGRGQDKPADPTYGGGFHPMPFSPGRVVDVATLEDRVTALEAWRIGVAPNDRDEPCETAEDAALDNDRRGRALAMLGTAETVIATGSAAEVGGVRLERCDAYGRTRTTEQLERVRHRLGILEREASELKDERDHWQGTAETLTAGLQQVRAERDAALAGAESAERDAAADQPRLGCATTAELITELAARADVSATIGEKWPTYRTVDSR